jgi:hypothetical protein
MNVSLAPPKLTSFSVMSCSKSLIVDTLPIDKQQTGAAWCKFTYVALM